jgi:hypothetical protein
VFSTQSKVLVNHNDFRKHRGEAVKRTLVTAVECRSADGGSLSPLIIWPAATHRSAWIAHPTPGWHFACFKTGDNDTEIMPTQSQESSSVMDLALMSLLSSCAYGSRRGLAGIRGLPIAGIDVPFLELL